MSCPTVIRVTTAQGPPGVGLPAGTGDAGKFVRKAGSTAYAYELVTPDAVGLPQDLAITGSPTFAGLTLSGLAANGLLFTGAGGVLTRLPLGGGLSITGGALEATQSGATDLSYDPTTRTVASSTGGDAVLTLADGTNAGLMSSADYLKLLSLTFGLLPVAVRNNSGAEIPKGVPVYVTGSSGTRVTIAPADASTEATAARTLGLTSAAIANNTEGTVIAAGPLEGLNTSALTEGQIIWLSETTGGMSTTRPTQPAHGVALGYSIKQGSGTAGIVYVKVDNGLEIDELHDVLITGKATGQALMVASDGLWKNRLLVASDISNGSTSGLTVLTGTPAQGRSALQLGSAAQSATTDFATPAALSSGLAGKADLDGTGKVPSAQLPGFVDDVLEFANLAAFPATGETGKLYISLATNQQYRWSGSTYVEINPSPGSTDGVPEGNVNLYFTTTRARAALSATGSLSYNPTTGTFSYTAPTPFDPASPGAIGGTTPAAATFTQLLLPGQASAPSTPATGFKLYANTSNALSWIGANGFVRVLDGTAITASRSWTLPDRNGTIALAEDLGGSATTRAANAILAGPITGSPASPTFRALAAQDLPPSVFSLHSTLTAASNTYTLSATAANEFTAGAAVAANTTITATNLDNIPSGYVWRGVFRFAYTSGAITFAAPGGFTAKPPVTAPTLTAGRTYDVIARVLGGGTVIDYRYGGDGYTT